MTDVDETREVDNIADTAALRGVVNPLKTKIELSQGKIRMHEHVVYNGQVKVAQATSTPGNSTETTWVYVQAESNNGASITLTETQTRQLRDLLDEVLKLNTDGDSNA